jgi:hypothetical protein
LTDLEHSDPLETAIGRAVAGGPSHHREKVTLEEKVIGRARCGERLDARVLD